MGQQLNREQREQRRAALKRRKPNWESGLNRAIDRARGRPFAWGTNDCFTIAAEIITEISGKEDVLKDYRGRYNNAASAQRFIKQFRHGVRGAALHILREFPQIHVHSAKRGDIVLLRQGDREIMGVCLGAEVAAPAEDGIHFLPLKQAVLAWGIGHK